MARVAIIADLLGANGSVFGGGAERQTYQLAHLAMASGADVTVYQAGRVPNVSDIEGVRVHSLQVDTKSVWSSATRQAIADGSQCFHYKYLAHVPRAAAGINATATHFAIYWDVPFDARYADWYPFGQLARFYLPPWRKLHKRRYLAAVGRCREVLADNTSLLRLVQSDSPNLRDRIYYAPNFSDLSPESNAHAHGADCVVTVVEQAKRAGRLIVLVPRNLTFKQGIALLPKLVETLQELGGHDCQLVVTGQIIRELPQSNHFEKQLKAALASMSPDSRSRLTFLNGVKHEYMPYFYEAADIVLLPSFASEGTPLSAIEAMTFGKAVVATNIGGLNDVIDSGYTGILVRPVAEELANAISMLTRDNGLRTRLGRAARDKAERQFSLAAWRSMVLPFMERNHWFAKS